MTAIPHLDSEIFLVLLSNNGWRALKSPAIIDFGEREFNHVSRVVLESDRFGGS